MRILEQKDLDESDNTSDSRMLNKVAKVEDPTKKKGKVIKLETPKKKIKKDISN